MSKKNDDNLVECPECGASVKSKNISWHLAKIHSKITAEYTQKIEEENKKIEEKKDRLSRRTVKTNYINKKRKKSTLSFGVLFIIIALIFAGYIYFGNNGLSKKGMGIEEMKGIIGEAATQNPVGNKTIAPNFSLTDATGKTISLQDFKDKVVILQFMQILSDCHGGYFYKSDDRTPYDATLKGYVKLPTIETIHQFEELKKIYNTYSDNVVIITIVIPPGCCGDPLKFSQDMKTNYSLGWYVASDTKQYDTWYKYMDLLPYDSNHILTSDPTILVLDKNQYVVYNSGYTDAATLGGI
jgi:hypothetical protein